MRAARILVDSGRDGQSLERRRFKSRCRLRPARALSGDRSKSASVP